MTKSRINSDIMTLSKVAYFFNSKGTMKVFSSLNTKIFDRCTATKSILYVFIKYTQYRLMGLLTNLGCHGCANIYYLFNPRLDEISYV